ncbi:MAG: DUF1028 domain-containing protein [Melioribacteraceae bacterium]|nr:DUF1028 domain-containing protein [Melioribacteraceae bacterium]
MNYFLFALIFLTQTIFAQSPIGKEPLAHTYSIVARDNKTGEMGVAVQSHWFSVGTLVAWGEAGVGVVATQSFVNPSFGPDGLAKMKEGMTAKQTLDLLIKNDDGRDVRQLGILDVNGNSASYTGSRCIPFAGHIEGINYSVQANMMKSETVWAAMEKAFLETENLPLAERLLAALEAAQAEGGDIRGKQSAAILVVRGESTGKIWEDRLVDLRIDDHSNPIIEMKRLLKVHRAYEHMNKGDLEIEHGNIKKAVEEYGTAEKMFPENLEMKYWHAVTLANAGEMEEALPLFKDVFSKDKNWHTLAPRLIKPELLTVGETDLQRIMNLIE